MNQNICLCYDREKGIFTRDCYDCDEVVFITYDTKGFKTATIELPFGRIKIESNFGFGRKSFLHAQIKCNEKTVLDFTKDKIRVLNHSSVQLISVASEDWESLLKKIVLVYKTYAPNICLT